MLRTRSLLPTALVVGLITLLVSAPIVEASPRVRVRTGNTSNSCRPSYGHNSHSYNNNRHHNTRHRSYSNRSRSRVSINIGGSYGSCYPSYSYGYRYTTRRPSYSYTYNYNTCPDYNTSYSYTRPVVRTVYQPVIVGSREPATGTVYTTRAPANDSWQSTTRTEVINERPRDTLLPAMDIQAARDEIRSARSEVDSDVRTERPRVIVLDDNSEPPLGNTGSTPTSANQEFVESTPDEMDEAWAVLLAGDASRARALFADIARFDETRMGEARMGYVISSLRDDDRRAAAISMVRLLESEPQLVRGGTLPDSDTLRSEITRLVETLKTYRDESVSSYERRMLISFLDLLVGETEEAQEAMRRARDAGAEGIAARNLWRLVGLSDKPLERVVGH